MSARTAAVPATTLELMHLRASQINGCSVCVDIRSHALDLLGAGAERINMVAAWREAPSTTPRVRLALTEAVTRLADSAHPVPDPVWEQTARHYTEDQLDREGRVLAALALEFEGAEIKGVRSIVNPDKLAHLGAVPNLGRLLRGSAS